MRKIAIVSCVEDWGGSEELWARSIPYLHHEGYQTVLLKSRINRSHPEFIALAEIGVNLIELAPETSLLKRVFKKAIRISNQLAAELKLVKAYPKELKTFKKAIQKEAPSLVIIAQGINFDGLKLANECLILGIPYVIISQKAVDFYWPSPNDRAMMLKVLQQAKRCFFVSHHNLRLTEEQFGKRLANAMVVFNPVKLAGNPLPYPATSEKYRLACVGRLFILDKGQDILLRILAQEEWRTRPVVISFIGKGPDEAGLKEMANLLKLDNVEFIGQVSDIGQIWQSHHALVLPSRSEGLPLSMVEAMSVGRPVIITDAGGNAELVEEGFTGFIGEANERSFALAMERAWQQRGQWELFGENAAKYVKAHVPASPEQDFAKLIHDILSA
ncbi:glycosyltransferase family 4 protein [Pedobacter sp. PLR]|uniref:glycosyltransferase family 4 protein n=1 Tax=Pedobacter sp. PLR TaxID=2994465 RepID=UPI0022480290|nr:glycosyltransferase family 4 protein [Pedobacter sp. PLR]MCX2449852.1 glycosyltransferase family 4 protein [Pedobacter sp. PLR]